MRHLQDRTINLGGRVDPNSKMYGGIYFEGNTDQATTIAVADTFYRIGTGNASHPLFATIIPTSDHTSAYWSLMPTTNPTAATQNIAWRGEDNTYVTVHWGLTLEGTPASEYTVRLTRDPSDGDPEAVVSTTQTTSVSVANLRQSFSHSTIVRADNLDQFYIELQNNTGATNVTVVSAYIVFTQ